MDWSIVVAIAAAAIAAATLLGRLFDKGLSVREFLEFKESVKEQLLKLTQGQESRLVIREFIDWRERITDDLDKLESDLKYVENTRPTSGELKLATDAVSARLLIIEDIVKNLNGRKN
jgi:hypothetical protein